jgi:cation:H+ antiporter
MILWLIFFVCALVIFISGFKLSQYADIIAEKSGLGRTWIGLFLMASITSIPELFTGIGAVTYSDVPDIAIGDVLGSCVFNMVIFAFFYAFYLRKISVIKIYKGHILSATFNILLLSIVALSIFVKEKVFPIGWVGPYTLLIILIYFIAIKFLYTFEKRYWKLFFEEMEYEVKYKDMPLKPVIIKYALNASAVIVAAILLPKIGKSLAKLTGLGETFVGNIFIAFATSLPEIVTTFFAIKIGAVDLAIGNVLGSNLFNIFILAIDDFFYTKGALLSFVEKNHLISAISCILMTSVAIIGFLYRTERKKFFIPWDSIIIFFIFLINMLLLYMIR